MTRALALSGVVVVVLAALLARELTDPLLPEPETPPHPAASRAASGAAPMPAVRLDDLAAVVLARPLMAPTRRPASEPAQPVAPQADLPRLAGVIVSPAGNRAIFAPQPGKPLVLAEGDVVGRYTIKSITPDQVILAGSEGDQVIRPRHANAGPALVTPPPVTPPLAAGRIRGVSPR